MISHYSHSNMQEVSYSPRIRPFFPVDVMPPELHPKEARATTSLEDEFILSMLKTIELHDSWEKVHAQRSAGLTLALAWRMGVRGKELTDLWRGAILHDLGKICISSQILHKPGPLTQDEWLIVRRHPEIGLEMLQPIDFLPRVLNVSFCHHERWDGSGYPRGLRGSEIPWEARLVAVVDVWEALCSDRYYRVALSTKEAREYISGEAGTGLDPEILGHFLKMQDETCHKVTLPVKR